jgi:putative ABC transport system permease protein
MFSSRGSVSGVLLALIATNLLRHKARTIATAAGIALGVGMIVALLSVGAGLKRTAGELVHLGQADMGIFQSGVRDPTASVLPVSMVQRLERNPDVAEATPLVLVVDGIHQNPAAIVFGAEPSGFFAQRLVMTEGARDLGARSILVGDRFAAQLGLRPGSTLTVKGQRLTVAGVYHTGIFFEDTGATVNLGVAQHLEHRGAAGTIGAGATTIAVQVANNVNQSAAEDEIRHAFPGTTVIGTNDDPSRIGANGELVTKAVTIIAALALILGGLGVTNTMAMAVLERERELALLSAVGWRRLRIAFLVLAEGVATSILGAGFGLLLGVIGADALNRALDVSSVVSPHVTPWTIGQALLIGVAIGVLGGLYPAWRGTTVSPTRVLGGA